MRVPQVVSAGEREATERRAVDEDVEGGAEDEEENLLEL